MDGLEATLQDARFVRGIGLLKEKRYEEAVVHFGDLLRTMDEVEGKTESLSIAPVYYEYGNALLSLAEATASVFGQDATKGEEGEEEDQNDLEVAWEMLEVARLLLSKHEGEDDRIDKELARVHMRLGDLGMESDLFQQARADYEKSLALQKKILTSTAMDTTPLADIYCCMAITCIYQHAKQPEAGTDEEETKTDEASTVSPEEMEVQGLRYYVLAGNVMRDNLYRQATSCSPACTKFLETHIPMQAKPESSKGKGKAKPPVMDAPVADLTLPYVGSMEDMRKTFVAAALNSRGVDPSTADDASTLLDDDEAKLLEYLEIYTEVKEKVDGLRENVEASNAEAAAAPVTTIGFGVTPAPAAAKRDSESAPVNVLPVAKKRKIAPTAVVDEAK
ncbi:hypothetical protein SPRG_20377 [Saprolegnia parasitica CBS 223.65]|uniref:Tetratricopeptide SHNi-TPR domain-containing protein n=1 Tax=Saprolegnia parasitica (strain CBS 223.65) TaxID=695850 RepID=A0A067CF06_SAPPC|nr:hypothetical protein SPRG_20377 [Saprolegnia parasitica CBS 223.65]KDO27735.1 hypothetical protein SPRG_20377 [Saprolegnia parasitica CBS 223.65]|eukprot:XP_012201607.1 hypothetical protein SPRG_20377 [Saprolegnia parasitica CBS 223.65]